MEREGKVRPKVRLDGRLAGFQIHFVAQSALRGKARSQPRRRTWASSECRNELAVAMAEALGHLDASRSGKSMVDDLRAAGMPVPLIGFILGGTARVVRQWQSGDRRPSGAAMRCLWLVHRLWMGDAPRTLADWFYWLPPRKPGDEPPSGMDGDGI